MTDPITICNNALADLGIDPILSFQDGSKRATLCARKFPSARDAVLELHPWNFATYKARLAQHPENSAYDWAYQYSLDLKPYCLKVLSAECDAKFIVGADYHYGRVLWSNTAGLRVTYTGRVEDTGRWQELAVKVLEKWLASEMAEALTGQSAKKTALLEEANGLVPVSRESDTREGKPVVLSPNAHLLAARFRRSGLRGW